MASARKKSSKRPRIETVTAGRIISIRSFGKACFLVLSDGRTRVQVYLRQDALSERDFKVSTLLDFGDHVGVAGHLFRTKTNEFSIWVSRLEFLSKCFIPLPEKWHGLQDVEIRYRQRYLDLIVNPDVRRVFEIRSRTVSAIRTFLVGAGFLEVETPMMQPIAGGALARPFVTHHNALDMKLFLRIAPELYLKRLVVGGIAKVFEINRNFRNEGIGYRWNPEFTMLEFYWAYADYHDLMDLSEQLLSYTVKEAVGGLDAAWGDATLSFAAPYARKPLRQLVAEAASARLGEPVTDDAIRDLAQITALAGTLGGRRREGAGAPEKWPPRSSRNSSRRRWCSRRSSTTIRPRSRRSRSSAPMTPIRSSASSSTSAAWKSRTPSASSTIRRSSGAGSRRSSPIGRAAIRKRTRWTRTTSARSSTACRRPAGKGSASIGW